MRLNEIKMLAKIFHFESAKKHYAEDRSGRWHHTITLVLCFSKKCQCKQDVFVCVVWLGRSFAASWVVLYVTVNGDGE